MVTIFWALNVLSSPPPPLTSQIPGGKGGGLNYITFYLALELFGILDVDEEPAVGVHSVVPSTLPVTLQHNQSMTLQNQPPCHVSCHTINQWPLKISTAWSRLLCQPPCLVGCHTINQWFSKYPRAHPDLQSHLWTTVSLPHKKNSDVERNKIYGTDIPYQNM